MNNTVRISLGVALVIIIGALIYFYSIKQAVPTISESTIKGCYVATLSKDVYTLTILSQKGESFEGTLSFKNFEKDSSSGTYKGTYKNGILLGKYSFQSEGTDSIMQVIFKKQGSDFIRGYGAMNETGDSFADLNNITYDSSAPFRVSYENCPGFF